MFLFVRRILVIYENRRGRVSELHSKIMEEKSQERGDTGSVSTGIYQSRRNSITKRPPSHHGHRPHPTPYQFSKKKADLDGAGSTLYEILTYVRHRCHHPLAQPLPMQTLKTTRAMVEKWPHDAQVGIPYFRPEYEQL